MLAFYGEIITERNNKHVCSYCPLILGLFGDNGLIELINTGREGCAIDEYLSNYCTKGEVSLPFMFDILALGNGCNPLCLWQIHIYM